MKVGCKGGGGETYAGFPLGQNLITSDMMTTNVLSFDLGANFWDDDNYDTVVTITARYEYAKKDNIPLPVNKYDYSLLSYSIHKQLFSVGRPIIRINANDNYSRADLGIKLSPSNVILGDSVYQIILTGVFINKTKKPISWNA